jgi:hypothetical protein
MIAMRACVAALLLGWAGGVAAQSAESVAAPRPGQPDDPVAAYLERQRLDEVLAAYLRGHLEGANSEDRIALAERLGKLYARLLGSAADPAMRQRLESASRQLMRDVPEADSSDLRLSLAKASYLRVEEIAERARLKLASGEEIEEAKSVLRALGTTFIDLAKRIEAQVKVLEKREAAARDQDMDALRTELADLRRLHSLARYYGGWSSYYDAMLNQSSTQAQRAMEEFGVLLNAAPNRPASVDRVPKQLLHYEHIARATLGCALSASIRNEHVEAIRWIDLLNSADDLPPAVADQLFTRELIVLAGAQRWSDVEVRVRDRRGMRTGTATKPLSPIEARLIAVLALEYGNTSPSMSRLSEIAQSVAAMAMSDLVAQRQVSQVLDLVQQYGTASLGNQGFIVLYVRGIRAYDEARAAHRVAAPQSPDEPVTDVPTVNMYRGAAEVLESTLGAPDSKDFPAERARTRTRLGLARYYAGEYASAVDAFVKASEEATTPALRGDALWYAIAALDYAIENGAMSNVAQRDRLALLYLREFPDTENAARLLLRQTNTQGMRDAEVVEVLLKVAPDSPLYKAARRQAATLLYKLYRAARGSDRDFAGLRFVQVGEDLLKAEQTAALASLDPPARDAANGVVLRARQLVDALLSVSGPDPDKAESFLTAIDTVTAYHAIDISQLQPELTFRRLQIAVIRNNAPAIDRSVDQLRSMPGPYADAADRLLYRRSQRLLESAPTDVNAAREVVRFGVRVLDGMGENAAAASSVRDGVATAAAVLWDVEQDKAMRDLALALDREQDAAGVRTLTALRRHARLAEDAGEIEEAGQVWSRLVSSVDAASPAWFEARYEAMRLLAKLDQVKARGALDQHEALYPTLGPSPWDEKFRELRKLLGTTAPATPTPPPVNPAANS